MDSTSPSLSDRPEHRTWYGRALLFALLVTVMFSFPYKPGIDLDASWRMALAQFFQQGLQFGTEVVFTYGPLGFQMGKTYAGIMWWELLVWQLVVSAGFTWVVMSFGERLSGYPRLYYYLGFLLFGAQYEDAMHMLGIVLLGIALLHRNGGKPDWPKVAIGGFLALLAVVKFTNLMLCGFVVLCAVGHSLWARRNREAALHAATFFGGFLLIWMLCGQNPLNLPAYFLHSLQISSGYQEAMGIDGGWPALWKGIVVGAALAGYILWHLWKQTDKPRAFAGCAMLAAFLYLSWKHGFVRADGHMIGFFYAALLPITAFPVLLRDDASMAWMRRWLMAPLGVLCLFGLYNALSGVITETLGVFQGRVFGNVYNALNLEKLRSGYNDRLGEQRGSGDMPKTRAIIGDRSVDVLGYEQSAAIFNRFNYQPRPVFQSYTVYTPVLARLNYDHYAGDRAPDFVLVKMHSLDGRLTSIDDSAVLALLMYRYEYVHTEKTYQLWRKRPDPFDPAAFAPKPLAEQTLPIGDLWDISAHAHQNLWIEIDARASLLGRARTFLYKPPVLSLVVEDTNGNRSTYRLPAPMGRAGFILNPLIEDLLGLVNFSGGDPERRVARVGVSLAEEDRAFYQPTAVFRLSTLEPTIAGQEFFREMNRERFNLFKTPPRAYEAQNPPSETMVDGEPAMILHAPSEMSFDVPRGATSITGKYGFMPGAYTEGGNTNGAEFIIRWSNGQEQAILLKRLLDPKEKADDRGLQAFNVDLSNRPAGRVYLSIQPGPHGNNSWDWTVWSNIEIK